MLYLLFYLIFSFLLFFDSGITLFVPREDNGKTVIPDGRVKTFEEHDGRWETLYAFIIIAAIYVTIYKCIYFPLVVFTRSNGVVQILGYSLPSHLTAASPLTRYQKISNMAFF